jgi:hypothetical protein
MKNSEKEKDKKIFHRRFMMEIAVVIAVREFMIDNTEDLRDWFVDIEMDRRRLKYGDNFDEGANKVKVDKVVAEYVRKRKNMIKALDKMNYADLEDNLEDSTLLDFYMEVINEMLAGTKDEITKGDKVIIKG